MAYPRNAASPERLAIGAVVQISDGAVQTSGVSISVRGQGGASGAGAGTTAYDNGVVEYTPTQGETDFTSFIVVAYKTGCIPVSQTVITSASATAGYSGVDWGKVTSATSTVGLTNTTVGTITTYTGNTVQTGDSFARLGAPAGASISADIAAIEAQTDDIGAAGAGLTAIPWNAAWDAEVQSEVQDALEANNLDHVAGTGTGIPAIPAGTYLDQMMDDGTAVYDRTTDSLQALRDNIGAAGAGLTAIDLPDQTMNITGNITGNLSGSVGSVTGAVGSVTGAVGSVTGAVGSVTGNVGGNVNGSVGSVAAGGIAAASFAAGAITATVIATNAIDADALAADAVTEIQAGLSTLTTAEVNAEVVDALATDTYAEPGQGAPAATTTLAAKINYLYKAFRNKITQTSTTYSLFDDAGTTVDQKSTVSDDGVTLTRGEIVSGP